MMRSNTLVALASIVLSGCSRSQSVFHPIGPDADRIATLSNILLVGGTLILLVMSALFVVALQGPPRWRRVLANPRSIMIGGVIFPLTTLTVLLLYGTILMRGSITNTPAENAVRIEIEGRQWWWRITYISPDGKRTETANELRIPVGRQISLSLSSADVIHSFWVPSLAGKIDLIPGRTTSLSFTARELASVRGQCAEFCGGPHALMAIRVITVPDNQFAQWLENERSNAQPSDAAGSKLFHASGCGACHAVRGSESTGQIAPDLTHLGSRLSLAADTLPMTPPNIARWITENQELKPGNHMPEFRHLDAAQVSAIAAYLGALK